MTELTPSPVRPEDYREYEARRWRELREAFLAEHRSVTAPELATLIGNKTLSSVSTVREWLREGRVFSVDHGATARIPLFQCDLQAGQPYPEVRGALAFLRQRCSNWQIAMWFTTGNTWTGDWRRPMELLGSEPDRLMEAARYEVAEKEL